MYGIEKATYAGSEERLSNTVAMMNKCAVAVESLSEIYGNLDGKSTVQLQEYSVNATKIMHDLGDFYKGSGCIGMESLSDLKNTIGGFITKLVTSLIKAVDYFIQLATELKKTATGLKKRAVAVAGQAASSEESATGIQFNDGRLFSQLNVGGKLPTNYADVVHKLGMTTAKLESIDFILTLDAIVHDVKNGKSPDEAVEKFVTNLSYTVGLALSKPTRENIAAHTGKTQLPNFSTPMQPGNICLNVHLPAVDRQLVGYTASIDSTKHVSSDTVVTGLTNKEIVDAAKAIRTYCDHVISQADLQKRVNSISRDLEAFARSDKMNELSKTIRPFVKMTDSPVIMHTRMSLTIMSRIMSLCEQSALAKLTNSGAK